MLYKSQRCFLKQSQNKKIRFVWNFGSSEDLTDMLLERNSYSKRYDFQITYTDRFDYLVCFNKTKERHRFNNSIWFGTEPSFSKHFDPTYIVKNFKYIFYHDISKFTGIATSRNILFEQPIWLPWYTERSLREILLLDTSVKTKKLSYIVSGLSSKAGDSNLYDLRLELLNKILESPYDIDIYGRGHKPIEDKRYKGNLDDKYDGLIPYEFTISIENCREKNYVSEKFFDAINCSTVPIYYGAPNVKELVPQNSFIEMNNLGDLDDLMTNLNKVTYNDFLVPIQEVKTKRITKDFFYILNDFLVTI